MELNDTIKLMESTDYNLIRDILYYLDANQL